MSHKKDRNPIILSGTEFRTKVCRYLAYHLNDKRNTFTFTFAYIRNQRKHLKNCNA